MLHAAGALFRSEATCIMIYVVRLSRHMKASPTFSQTASELKYDTDATTETKNTSSRVWARLDCNRTSVIIMIMSLKRSLFATVFDAI